MELEPLSGTRSTWQLNINPEPGGSCLRAPGNLASTPFCVLSPRQVPSSLIPALTTMSLTLQIDAPVGFGYHHSPFKGQKGHSTAQQTWCIPQIPPQTPILKTLKAPPCLSSFQWPAPSLWSGSYLFSSK